MKMLDLSPAYEAQRAKEAKQVAVASAAPVTTQPVVTWVALTTPAPLQYDGTTVQAVQAALRRAFLDEDNAQFPIKLERKHLPILRGMMAAAGAGSTPYEILHTALDRFGEIEVRDR